MKSWQYNYVKLKCFNLILNVNRFDFIRTEPKVETEKTHCDDDSTFKLENLQKFRWINVGKATILTFLEKIEKPKWN